VTVVTVASDGGRPSTVMTAATATTVAATAAAMTTVARFKKSEILNHCFSTLDRIYWTTL